MTERSKILLVVALAVCGGLSHFAGGISPYYLDILIGIGINIILAVSLNLVNGYTGQFSLGHAGFMSVGAYAAAGTSLFVIPKLFGQGGAPLQQGLLFLVALAAGGVGAALAGFVVGVPSLR